MEINISHGEKSGRRFEWWLEYCRDFGVAFRVMKRLFLQKERLCSVVESAVNWNQTFESNARRQYAKLLFPEKRTMVKNKRELKEGFVLAKGRMTGLLKFCTV